MKILVLKFNSFSCVKILYFFLVLKTLALIGQFSCRSLAAFAVLVYVICYMPLEIIVVSQIQLRCYARKIYDLVSLIS